MADLIPQREYFDGPQRLSPGLDPAQRREDSRVRRLVARIRFRAPREHRE